MTVNWWWLTVVAWVAFPAGLLLGLLFGARAREEDEHHKD
jgi:hypothetical protein